MAVKTEENTIERKHSSRGKCYDFMWSFLKHITKCQQRSLNTILISGI